MKRYLLFGGSIYYPSGGWEDFVGSYNTIEDCLSAWGKSSQFKDMEPLNWCHVLDLDTGQIVYKESEGEQDDIPS